MIFSFLNFFKIYKKYNRQIIFFFVLFLVFFVKVQSAKANFLPVQCRVVNNGNVTECTADASQCVGELVVNVSANWTAGNCLPGACGTNLEIAFQGWAGPYTYGQIGDSKFSACQPNSSGTVSFSMSSTFTGGWVTTSAGIGAPQFDRTQVGGIDNTTTVECQSPCTLDSECTTTTQCVNNAVQTITSSCVNGVCIPNPPTIGPDCGANDIYFYCKSAADPVSSVWNKTTTRGCDERTGVAACYTDIDDNLVKACTNPTLGAPYCQNNQVYKDLVGENCAGSPPDCVPVNNPQGFDKCGGCYPTGNVRCSGSIIQLENQCTTCGGSPASCQPGGSTNWTDFLDCGPPSDTSFSWCDPGGVKCTLTTNYPGMCQGSPTSGTSATCVAPTVDLICGG
ncbi:MAG: hypothetical protein Q7R49_05720, partial [Candidatus Daviesbacteria bacterium]|nr:hypothetical protein [Candidatus Daviesbacteria bacterium]